LQLLTFLGHYAEQKLCHMFTGDETWGNSDNQGKSMWANTGAVRPRRVRRTVAQKGSRSRYAPHAQGPALSTPFHLENSSLVASLLLKLWTALPGCGRRRGP
jgi:hypothetical protein